MTLADINNLDGKFSHLGILSKIIKAESPGSIRMLFYVLISMRFKEAGMCRTWSIRAVDGSRSSIPALP